MLRAQKIKKIAKNEILTFLKEQKPYLKKEFGVTKIALFGSYARGEETSKSDIDILIEVKVHNFRNRIRLCNYLESNFNKKVDLLYFDAVRKFIMRNIQEDIVYA